MSIAVFLEVPILREENSIVDTSYVVSTMAFWYNSGIGKRGRAAPTAALTR
jgi:hypothetical protein